MGLKGRFLSRKGKNDRLLKAGVGDELNKALLTLPPKPYLD